MPLAPRSSCSSQQQASSFSSPAPISPTLLSPASFAAPAKPRSAWPPAQRLGYLPPASRRKHRRRAALAVSSASGSQPSLQVLIAYAARMTPLAGEIHLDGRVLLFGAVAALLTGVLFGSIPGFIASRSKLRHPRRLRRQTAGSEGGTRTRNILVAVQVAFSFVLLMCAG